MAGDTGSADAPSVQGEPTLQRSRIVRWFVDRPRIADVLVILVCTAPTVAALIIDPPAHAWFGYLCALGVAVAFWWRRSHPLVVLLVVVAFAALNPLAARGASVAVFESAFALYALAVHARLRVVILGYLASEAVILAVSGAMVLLGRDDTWGLTGLQPISLAAIALGVAVRAGRSRRAAVEELIVMREDRAAAAERARITAEMHDVVAHSVTVMVALAGGAAAGWEKHPERARKALDQLGDVGARTLEEMQRILRVLRERDEGLDRDLESSGHNLPPLTELVEVFRAAGLPVSLSVSGVDAGAAGGVGAGEGPRSSSIPDSDPALRTTVYRVVQESLTNALRHARGATWVEVEVARLNDRLTVTVTDNGHASRPGSSVGAGVGLRAMRERAAAFHGEFESGPVPSSAGAPGTGWRTRVSLPVGLPEASRA